MGVVVATALGVDRFAAAVALLGVPRDTTTGFTGVETGDACFDSSSSDPVAQPDGGRDTDGTATITLCTAVGASVDGGGMK